MSALFSSWLHAPRCNTLRHTSPHCNTMQHTALHCTTLHYTSAHSMCGAWHILHVCACAHAQVCVGLRLIVCVCDEACSHVRCVSCSFKCVTWIILECDMKVTRHVRVMWLINIVSFDWCYFVLCLFALAKNVLRSCKIGRKEVGGGEGERASDRKTNMHRARTREIKRAHK